MAFMVNGNGVRLTPLVTGSTTSSITYTINYTGTFTWATNNTWDPPKKIKNGKYQVRCRECGRWAKVLKELPNWRWLVWCDRCLGENEGMIKW